MQTLPGRFESILRSSNRSFMPLILPVESDLRRFKKLARFNQNQNAGSICIISNSPGQGKTTAAYAATVILKDTFNAVISVPPPISLALRDIPKWLSGNIPEFDENYKTNLILIDGRESTDDDQGLKDVMGVLNNLVRGRPDLLFVWPTTDDDWRDRLVSTARNFGSQGLCPADGIFSVEGPSKNQWVEAVRLILEQISSNWDEFGINESTASQLVDNYKTLGDFITAINQLRTDQEDFGEAVTGLPQVLFVVSSHSQVVSDVARLRNSSNYRLRTDEVISSARRSEPGKFWTERGSRQKSNLAWVSALLEAKLVSLTPSTVAHACALESQVGSRLRDALVPLPFRASRGTGNNAYRTTDLARFLANEPVPEVLTKNKGKTSDLTVEAYDAIQLLSSKQHKSINESILKFISQIPGASELGDISYEVKLGDDAIVDAVVPVDGRRLHFEFHHISGKHCSPNHIATYMMKKLRVYATQYNLIER